MGRKSRVRLPLSKGHQQEKAQPQQQKRQQQQDLYGKAIKVAGKEARNMTVNVAVIKKFPIYVIYSNTLVHSSPHLPVYCMGRWVRLHCFFSSNGNIKYDTTFYA